MWQLNVAIEFKHISPISMNINTYQLNIVQWFQTCASNWMVESNISAEVKWHNNTQKQLQRFLFSLNICIFYKHTHILTVINLHSDYSCRTLK